MIKRISIVLLAQTTCMVFSKGSRIRVAKPLNHWSEPPTVAGYGLVWRRVNVLASDPPRWLAVIDVNLDGLAPFCKAGYVLSTPPFMAG